MDVFDIADEETKTHRGPDLVVRKGFLVTRSGRKYRVDYPAVLITDEASRLATAVVLVLRESTDNQFQYNPVTTNRETERERIAGQGDLSKNNYPGGN